MTTAELLAQLQAAFPPTRTSGSFQAAAVRGGEYAPLLERAGLPPTLGLTSPDGWVQAAGEVVLAGTLTTPALGLAGGPIAFVFTPDGDDFLLRLTLSLPPTWTFAQSFPSLAGGVFDELALDPAHPATLVLSSAPPAGQLGFSAAFATNAGLVTQLAWLLDGGASLPVAGPISYDAARGTLEMTLPLATARLTGLFGESGPELSVELALHSGLDAALGQYTAGVLFETKLDFGEQVRLRALLVDSAEGVVDLTLDGDALGFPEPDILARYFGADNGIATALPGKFSGGKLVQVDSLTFGIGLARGSLEYAFLAVGALTGQTWSVWPGVIELGDLTFDCRVFEPLSHDQASFAFTFSARLKLGDTVALLVRAELPGEVLSIGLDRSQDEPGLAALLRHVFDDDFGVPDDLLIADLTLSADVSEHVYSGEIEVEGEWSHEFGTDNTISFEDLLVQFGYSEAEGPSGELAARFAVGASDFHVTLDLAKGNTVFKGEWTDRGSPLDYQDIAIALGLYGLPNLPAGVDLALTEASFSFASAGPSFAFELTTASGGGAALIAGKDAKGDWGFVYGMILSLDVTLDLTDIDVIGRLVPSGDERISLSDLRVVGAGKVVPEYSPTPQLERIVGPSVSSGLALSTKLELGTAINQTLTVRFGGADDGSAIDTPPNMPAGALATGEGPTTGAPPAPQATWISVQRAFGPVQFDRIGFAITPDDEVALLFDAAISLGGLTVGLVGLEAAMPIRAPYVPVFSLAGLQVGFTGGGVQISGGLEQVPATPAPEYTGELTVKLASFGLSMFGSYTTVAGQPSLFAFLFLDVPLGGPAFFFVTGLAGGFGYNRSLQLPSIDQVAAFPLVAGATGALDAAQTETQLNAKITPQLGADWLAAGVKFTSFEMVTSFALLTVAFGTQFEIALLGESTISVPVAVKGETAAPVAQAQMVLLVDFAPAIGQLAVSAQLGPQSYVLDKAAQLTGGFAFYVWFSPSPQAGDFVITLGGYNPYFTPPPYYPSPPRLGLNWRVSAELGVKGGLYFALTPSVLMAGGALEATWHSGDIDAWFDAQADFLIRFKPFEYLIDVAIEIGVSLTVDLWVTTARIAIHAGVTLTLWGPPFGGTARVEVSVISFTLGFGATTQPPPQNDLDWTTFRRSFLPPANASERAGAHPGPTPTVAVATPTPTPTATDSIVTISVASGLRGTIQTVAETPVWLVDPAQLRIDVATQVPSTAAAVVTSTTSRPSGSWNDQFGIGPMGAAPGTVTAELTITVERGGVPDIDSWQAHAATAGVPAGLWVETAGTMRTHGLLDRALTGVALTPAPSMPDKTLAVAVADFAAEPVVRRFAWSGVPVPRSDPFDQATGYATLERSLVDPTIAGLRRDVLAELRAQGLSVAVAVAVDDFAAHAADLLASPPQLRLLGEEPGVA
jgi:hypothetical protein